MTEIDNVLRDLEAGLFLQTRKPRLTTKNASSDAEPVAGVLTIGFIFGAYLTEAFRGAFLAVPPGQREAGLAYGMSTRQVLWRITLPQMLRHALPGLSNNWLVMIKATAIVSVIGLSDLMTRGQQAADQLRHLAALRDAVARGLTKA